MAFVPQNFKDMIGPPIHDFWLNGVDVLCNSALAGAQTVPEVLAALGLVSGITAVPVPINEGGTGATDAPTALANLGGVTGTQVVNTINATYIGNLIFPETAAEHVAAVAAGMATLVVNIQYEVGNLLRYGIIPNDSSLTTATNNRNILNALLTPGPDATSPIRGPTGRIYSPQITGLDQYFFNGMVMVRPGVDLDLGGTSWMFSKTAVASDNANGFLWIIRKVRISNGSIYGTYLSGSGGASIALISIGGRDGAVVGSPLPKIFDSQLPAAMGDIIIENLYMNGTNQNPASIMLGFEGLGGIQRVVMNNVQIEGNNSMNGGLYYEFGWATDDPAHGGNLTLRQTSHAHDWKITNVNVYNCTGAQGFGAFEFNGAYALTFENFYASNCAAILSFGTGESLFRNPWVGVDDFGSLPQNTAPGTAAAGRYLVLKNIRGRQIDGSAIVVSNAGTSGWTSQLGQVTAWTPGIAYVVGNKVFNGAASYICTTGGTSSNAAGFAGPKGTGSGITDGTVVWNYQSSLGGTGYNGWQVTKSYLLGATVINGQYAYTCTTAGTSGVQGPTGVGTGITDGSCVWQSNPTASATGIPLNSAFTMEIDQLSLSLDGFVIDSGVIGSSSGGYGVFIPSALCADIRNGKITNMFRGVVTGTECTRYNIENVTVLNSGSIGMELGLQNPTYYPMRQSMGCVRGCFIAGSGTGAGGQVAIAAAFCVSLLIENNRFGYELAHDGIPETTQNASVDVGPTAFGVTCNNNYTGGVVGGIAYAQVATTSSQGNSINNPQGITTSSGFWARDGIDQANSTQIASASSAINVFNKYFLAQVWDTSNNRLMIAQGPNPTDKWIIAGFGTVQTTVTPV